MGETPTETLSEIEATRAKLERDLSVLESRLPETDDLKQQAAMAGGAVAGAGVLLVVLWTLIKRAFARRSLRKQARMQAEALADVLGDGIPIQARVEHVSSKTGPLALLLALAGIAIGGLVAYRQQQGADLEVSSPRGDLS